MDEWTLLRLTQVNLFGPGAPVVLPFLRVWIISIKTLRIDFQEDMTVHDRRHDLVECRQVDILGPRLGEIEVEAPSSRRRRQDRAIDRIHTDVDREP